MLKEIIKYSIILAIIGILIALVIILQINNLENEPEEIILKAIKNEYNNSDYVTFTLLKMENSDANYAYMIIAIDERDINHIKMDYWGCTIYSSVIDLDKFKTELI